MGWEGGQQPLQVRRPAYSGWTMLSRLKPHVRLMLNEQTWLTMVYTRLLLCLFFQFFPEALRSNT